MLMAFPTGISDRLDKHLSGYQRYQQLVTGKYFNNIVLSVFNVELQKIPI